MANDKVLSNQEIDYIEKVLNIGESKLEDGIAHITDLINQFENEPIVQSFFVAGNFGKAEQEKFIKIKSILDREKNNVCDNLIPATKNYLKKHKNLNESGEE